MAAPTVNKIRESLRKAAAESGMSQEEIGLAMGSPKPALAKRSPGAERRNRLRSPPLDTPQLRQSDQENVRELI